MNGGEHDEGVMPLVACGYMMTIEFGDEEWLSVTFTQIRDAA